MLFSKPFGTSLFLDGSDMEICTLLRSRFTLYLLHNLFVYRVTAYIEVIFSRLQELQEQMVGGEKATNEEVKERRRKKKRYAEERKTKLAGMSLAIYYMVMCFLLALILEDFECGLNM